MKAPATDKRPSLIGLTLTSGLLTWGALHTAPLMEGGTLRPLPVALTALAGLTALKVGLEALVKLASGIEWLAARQGSGKSGTARWAKPKDYKGELCGCDSAPFWGLPAYGAQKLLFDFVSNAYVLGPAGSGKGHTAVVPMILLIAHSKIITDFKPELLAICKKGLEARGQNVVSLNPFGKYTELVGPSDQLNPLDIITDNLFTPGGLPRVFSDGAELSMQLYQDPPNSKGDDQYWRGGSRRIIVLASVLVGMMEGRSGALSDVALLLDDPFALEMRLALIAGLDREGKPDPDGAYLFELSEWAQCHDDEALQRFLKTVRAKAAGMLRQMRESEKTFASFLEGAQQALEPFGFGELSSSLGQTSFDFNAIKNGGQPLNIFLVGDASKAKATEQYFGLMQWYMQLLLKRHPNKNAPVYMINDEAANYAVYGLVSLLTWGRGFGIRIIQFFQNFAAYEAKHGKQAVEVLQSESEIKLILPGQRAPGTLKAIVEMLGEQSVMTANLSADKQEGGLNETLSESGRTLMTRDELRRTDHGILFVRGLRPILQQPVSYSEISPLREMADINPHHGKPFLNKVKLKLDLKHPGGDA